MAGFFIAKKCNKHTKNSTSYQLRNDMLQLFYFFTPDIALIYFSRDK